MLDREKAVNWAIGAGILAIMLFSAWCTLLGAWVSLKWLVKHSDKFELCGPCTKDVQPNYCIDFVQVDPHE